MKNHRAGGKISGKHTTIIDAAAPIINCLEKLACVSKITLGIIEQIGQTRVRHLKITEIPAGLRVVVRGNICRQELIIFTSQQKQTQAALESISLD